MKNNKTKLIEEKAALQDRFWKLNAKTEDGFWSLSKHERDSITEEMKTLADRIYEIGEVIRA